jgi:hypothetical protein
MSPTDNKRTLWSLCGMLFFLLMNYPLLQIANAPLMVWGIPAPVLYLHAVWLGAILALYVLSRRLASRD